MAEEIYLNKYKFHQKKFNPLTLRSDEYINSPYNFNTLVVYSRI